MVGLDAMMQIELSRLDLDETKGLRRHIPRPTEHRQPGYDEQFDALNVFYDCFASLDGRRLICLGPPLWNLEPVVVPAVERYFRKALFSRRDVRRLDRNAQIWMKRRRNCGMLEGGYFNQEQLVVQPNQCELFRGKRVLLGISKNNELSWIRDWVWFYVSSHGCNAVLLYDNASTQYGVEQIYEALSPLRGLDVILVMTWPYKWGCLAGPNEIWDSDFAHYGMLEHARHRFLSRADGVVNSDIDELVVTKSGRSIFDLVGNSRTGYLNYAGIMIENVSVGEVVGKGRHRDFVHRQSPPQPATRKWSVVPSRCPVSSQWCVHHVTEMRADEEASTDVTHRHFMTIRTPWKYPRSTPQQPAEHHQVDEELVNRMRCFHDTAD